MRLPFARTRLTALLSVLLLIALAGVAQGSAGDPLVLGQNNSADKSNTTLTTVSAGVGLGVTQSGGIGPAVQGTDSSTATSATGVMGLANGSTANITYGVRGISASTDGRGVFGDATAGSGTTYGVYGVAKSLSGYGVYSNGTLGISSGSALAC